MTPLTPRRTAAITAIAAALTGAAALASTASAGLVATRTCHGLPVTVKASTGTVVGTSGPDVIKLTGPATVRAGAGADVICGSRGNDTIYAGPGDDTVLGRRGADTLYGETGRDHLYGEQGADTLVGGAGSDVLMGGSGRDTVHRSSIKSSNQLGGDRIVNGTMAVSVLTNDTTVMTLAQNGLTFGTSWVPSQGEVTVTGIAASMVMPSTAFTFERRYGVWAVPGMGDLFPDLNVLGGAVAWGAPMNPDSIANLTADGTMSMSASADGGAAFWLTNFTPGPVATGLGIAATADGWSPMPYVPTGGQIAYPNMSAQFAEPVSLNLFVGPAPSVQPGMAMGAIPAPSTQVSFASGPEVRSVYFDINQGFVQG